MLIRGEQLAAQLQRGLAPVYVAWGDELLTIEAADAVRAAARQAGYDERETHVALPGFSWSLLLASAANLSLFGGRKIIDLRIPSGKPGTEGAQSLQTFAASASSDTLLLVTLPDLGWQEEKAAWLGALVEAGVGVKSATPGIAELPGWIAGRLKRQQQTAEPEALRFIAERVEGNLLAAHQEIMKLGLLHPPGQLSLDAVRSAILNVARYDLDTLREALLAGSLERFSRTLDGLRQEGEALPLVLWAITEEVRALAVVADGQARGRPLDALLKDARVWGPRQGPFRRAATQIAPGRAAAALRELAQIDRMIKGVAAGNPWIALLSLGKTLWSSAAAARR